MAWKALHREVHPAVVFKRTGTLISTISLPVCCQLSKQTGWLTRLPLERIHCITRTKHQNLFQIRTGGGTSKKQLLAANCVSTGKEIRLRGKYGRVFNHFIWICMLFIVLPLLSQAICLLRGGRRSLWILEAGKRWTREGQMSSTSRWCSRFIGQPGKSGAGK